ncbi:MAG TPA: universal stress protein [Acidobacteriaceae bacterium]|jgi:nucleotide-binding universal stress UspA family protein|nr:universal stress protein [Acidobacteriaceae bacterium]
MGLITNILFPVDFSPSCVAMAPWVSRSAAIFGARVSLIHVFNPASYSGFEQTLRRPQEIAEDHEEIARHKLNAFLTADFSAADCPRIIVAGDPATQIAAAARKGFDLIIMPTHAGTFRRMLLGSTTAKVLNDADCPVLTSRHAETIAPRPLEHREWLCTVGLGEDSERVLRFAHRAATEAHGNLWLIHAIQSADEKLPIQLDLQERIQSAERQQARQRIDALQSRVGSKAQVRIAVGQVKEALLEAARRFDADALMIGRSPQSGAQGRLRDLTYAVVRDSPFPVLSI